MTGAELLTFVQRRLAEQGLTVEADRQAELFDYITAGRDDLRLAFAITAPVVVRSFATLEVDPANDRWWNLPAGSRDPMKILRVYDLASGDDLLPAANLNADAGHYRWRTLRQLELADDCGPEGSVAIEYVYHGSPVSGATAEADIGLPTAAHRAIGYHAAVLALTADEESNATSAMGLLQRELARLEELYAGYDDNAGQALGVALLAAVGAKYGDLLT